MYAYRNLPEAQNTLSGVGDYVLIAPVRDFQTISCPEAPFTNPGDEVKILSPHVFKAGKAFAKWTLAPEKNKLDGAASGDKGFQRFGQTLEVMVQGSYAILHEAIKNIMNVPLIVLVPDANCATGLWYQLGCECQYAWASPSFGTGTTADGNKGYTIPITYNSESIQIYAAGAPEVLADASVS